MAEMKDVFDKAESKMKKAVGHLQEEYAAIRAGRANPAVLDKIMVNYYDTPTPINQLAAVAVTEARVLTIQPWDASVLRELVKETSKLAEEAKVAVRSIRRDGIEKLKDMKKKSEITEDDLKQAEKKAQELTDKYVKNIDACAADKEKEILEI